LTARNISAIQCKARGERESERERERETEKKKKRYSPSLPEDGSWFKRGENGG